MHWQPFANLHEVPSQTVFAPVAAHSCMQQAAFHAVFCSKCFEVALAPIFLTHLAELVAFYVSVQQAAVFAPILSTTIPENQRKHGNSTHDTPVQM